jgi:hypothetical protein
VQDNVLHFILSFSIMVITAIIGLGRHGVSEAAATLGLTNGNVVAFEQSLQNKGGGAGFRQIDGREDLFRLNSKEHNQRPGFWEDYTAVPPKEKALEAERSGKVTLAPFLHLYYESDDYVRMRDAKDPVRSHIGAHYAKLSSYFPPERYLEHDAEVVDLDYDDKNKDWTVFYKRGDETPERVIVDKVHLATGTAVDIEADWQKAASQAKNVSTGIHDDPEADGLLAQASQNPEASLIIAGRGPTGVDTLNKAVWEHDLRGKVYYIGRDTPFPGMKNASSATIINPKVRSTFEEGMLKVTFVPITGNIRRFREESDHRVTVDVANTDQGNVQITADMMFLATGRTQRTAIVDKALEKGYLSYGLLGLVSNRDTLTLGGAANTASLGAESDQWDVIHAVTLPKDGKGDKRRRNTSPASFKSSKR